VKGNKAVSDALTALLPYFLIAFGVIGMKIRVRFFASLREAAGAEEIVGDVPAGTTVKGLFDILARDRKSLSAEEEHTLAAVNESQVEWTRKLKQGDIVAFYPPVGGG